MIRTKQFHYLSFRFAREDVQRGRDFGVPGYNYFREYCGLKKAYNFGDLAGELDNRTIHRLSMLYKHVDDIDLFTAGISEFPSQGSMLGPTFSCIVVGSWSFFFSCFRELSERLKF